MLKTAFRGLNRNWPAQAFQMPKAGEQYGINKFATRAYHDAGLTCRVCLDSCAEVFEKIGRRRTEIFKKIFILSNPICLSFYP